MTQERNRPGEIVQGTVVALAVDPDGPLAGVMLRGASGSGKSDLALRLVEACRWRRTRLVADDAAAVAESAGRLQAVCPPTIAGHLEVRGVGLLPFHTLPAIDLRLVCDLGEQPARLPVPVAVPLIAASAVRLPVMQLRAFDASAPARLRHAMRALLAGQFAAVRQDGSLSPAEGQMNT